MAPTNAVERLARESGCHAREEKSWTSWRRAGPGHAPLKAASRHRRVWAVMIPSNWGDGLQRDRGGAPVSLLAETDGKPNMKIRRTGGSARRQLVWPNENRWRAGDDYASLAALAASSPGMVKDDHHRTRAKTGGNCHQHEPGFGTLRIFDGRRQGTGERDPPVDAVVRHGKVMTTAPHGVTATGGNCHQHESGIPHHGHSGRDPPVRQRLPQAADEEKKLLHPHRGAGRRPKPPKP